VCFFCELGQLQKKEKPSSGNTQTQQAQK